MFNFFNRKVFNSGYLPEHEGHEVFFQEVGNKDGEIVLHFLGGPGGRSSINQAKNYNLKKQRVILFDQRGTGLSKTNDLTNLNDTGRLVKDAKRLLDYLGIDTPISVGGGSWGTTLALLFAIKYPKLVKNICLYSVFLARREDMEYMLKHTGLFYPDMLEEIKKQSEGENPYTYYAKLIFYLYNNIHRYILENP
jgi:proline iminopeptidase